MLWLAVARFPLFPCGDLSTVSESSTSRLLRDCFETASTARETRITLVPYARQIHTRKYCEDRSAAVIMDRAFLNVMILSWGFMLVFTAFQTMGNIEVSDNAARDCCYYSYCHYRLRRRALPRFTLHRPRQLKVEKFEKD